MYGKFDKTSCSFTFFADDFERPMDRGFENLHLRFLTALGTLKSFSDDSHWFQIGFVS